jgi:hypothetical protein
LISRLLAVAALCLEAETSALAMTCGTCFIVEGQSEFEVLRLCGRPTWTTNRFDFAPTNPGFMPGAPFLAPVEDWIYDRGSTKFMEKLTFSNGRVIRIETLGYGG